MFQRSQNCWVRGNEFFPSGFQRPSPMHSRLFRRQFSLPSLRIMDVIPWLLMASAALSMALTPFIGQNWGAHRIDRVADALRLAERVVIVWGAMMWVLMLFVRERVASVFTSDPEVLKLASEYLFYIPLAYGATGIVSV